MSAEKVYLVAAGQRQDAEGRGCPYVAVSPATEGVLKDIFYNLFFKYIKVFSYLCRMN